MLFKDTVNSPTLELLKNLQEDILLKDFFLVGGTALSLQIGHRLSIDIDLFTLQPFNVEEIIIHLEQSYQFILDYQSKNSIKGEINGVKVDLISHQYPLCEPLIEIEQLRMASLKEISAMKLNAIIVNGTRLKDFVDVVFLTSFLSLSQMLEAYELKYQTRNPMPVLKSLNYFDDINFNEPIQLIDKIYEWATIEKRLIEMVLKPNLVF